MEPQSFSQQASFNHQRTSMEKSKEKADADATHIFDLTTAQQTASHKFLEEKVFSQSQSRSARYTIFFHPALSALAATTLQNHGSSTTRWSIRSNPALSGDRSTSSPVCRVFAFFTSLCPSQPTLFLRWRCSLSSFCFFKNVSRLSRGLRPLVPQRLEQTKGKVASNGKVARSCLLKGASLPCGASFQHPCFS